MVLYHFEEGFNRLEVYRVESLPALLLHVYELTLNQGAEIVRHHALLLTQGLSELGHVHGFIHQAL